MTFYECKDCPYGTNSPNKQLDHAFHTGHYHYNEYQDDEE